MSGFSVVEVLKVGFSGGVFLLFYLAYRLLRAEQSGNQQDRERRSLIRLYCWLSLCGAILICIGSAANNYTQGRQQGVQECLSRLRTLDTMSKQADMTTPDLQAQLTGASTVCISILEKT